MEKKRTPNQLQEALDYSENIVSTLREPLLVLDADLRIVSASRAFYQKFSFELEETEGRLIYEVGNGQWNIPELRELLENILPKNTSFDNFEVEHDFPGLGRRTMILNARRIHDGGPRTKKILLAVEDITERKRFEHDMVSSELRYRRLFETAQDGILILDAQSGEITDSNPFVSQTLGFSREELLGKKLWEIGFFKDSAASHQAFQTLQDKGYVRYEDLPLQTKDGRPMQVEFVSNVYRIDGDQVIQCNIRDITERKQAEERIKDQYAILTSIIESPNAPIFSVDSHYCYTSFNSRHALIMKSLYGANIHIGKSLLEYMSVAEDRNNAKNNLDNALKGGVFTEEAYSGEDSLSRRYFEVTHFPVRDAGSNIIGASVFAKDITFRKLAEDQVKKLNKTLAERASDLEMANNELEAFSYTVSHDLRAPLRSMEGFSQALFDDYPDKLDGRGKQYLSYIQESACRMSQMIDDILKLSRLGRGEVQKDRIDLSKLAESVVAELQKTDPGRLVKFSITSGIEGSGDPRLLRVALENLLGNAWKYTAKTRKPVIEFASMMEKGKKTYFVRDNGAGFDMAYANRLFKPFQRLHSASEFPGSGIGLASVQRIISRHGGRVSARGEVGKGATFFFTLD